METQKYIVTTMNLAWPYGTVFYQKSDTKQYVPVGCKLGEKCIGADKDFKALIEIGWITKVDHDSNPV